MTNQNHPTKVEPTYHIDGSTFWNSGRDGYALLSYLSSTDDWSSIIGTVSTEIANSVNIGEKPNVLDYGSGIGTSAYHVRKRLLSSYKLLSNFVLLEPDKNALNVSKSLFPSAQYESFHTDFASSREEVSGAHKFQAVTFIHSTYYIHDLEKLILDLKSTGRFDTSKWIFVVLSEKSPFFLGQEEHGHSNLPSEIVELLKRLGMKVSVTEKTSRLSIPPGLWDDPAVVRDWKDFTQFDFLPKNDLQRRLRTHLHDGVDLKDVIIVASE